MTKKNNIHPANLRLPTRNLSWIEEEEAEELQNKQASLSRQSITLPVPTTIVVVIFESRGLSYPITMGIKTS